jgi:hypothetical protein
MMLLPLYIHPLEDPRAWESVCQEGERVTAIVNVHNGPGGCRDEAYAVATSQLQASGVRMLGYVDLDYGGRTNGEVWCDIVGWAQYPVDGVFFDRAPTDEPGVAYVAQVVRAVRGTVALNPGTRCASGYAALADLVCTFEGPWSCYADSPAQAGLPEGRDWPNAVHLVYGVPQDCFGAAIALLLSRAPHGLITDLDAPLPYAGLPAPLRGGAAGALPDQVAAP